MNYADELKSIEPGSMVHRSILESLYDNKNKKMTTQDIQRLEKIVGRHNLKPGVSDQD